VHRVARRDDQHPGHEQHRREGVEKPGFEHLFCVLVQR
jgi:hypothetical protein